MRVCMVVFAHTRANMTQCMGEWLCVWLAVRVRETTRARVFACRHGCTRSGVRRCPCVARRAHACVFARTQTCTWKSVNAQGCISTCPSRHLNICTHASPRRVGPPALQANHSAVVPVPRSLCHCIPLLGVVAPRPRALTELDKSE